MPYKNPEQARAYHREYVKRRRAANPEFYREQDRVRARIWRDAHPQPKKPRVKMTSEQRAASARAAEKRYREKNRERARAAALAWRAANPERAKENSRRYYAENPGYYRAWQKKNAERLRARAREKYHADIDASRAAARADQKKYRAYRASVQAKRRAALLRATPPWADKEKIEAFYREAARLTTETGIRHEVDHVWPLQGKTGCGLHVHENLQILTKPDNIRKYNNAPDQP